MTARVWDRTRWDRCQASLLVALLVTAPSLPLVLWVAMHVRVVVIP